MADVASDHKLPLQAKNLKLELHDGGVAMQGDAAKIRVVLDNLLSNAIKFSPPGGVISMAVRADSGELIVDVSDQGPGINADDRPHVFEPFYQGRVESLGPVKGSGLGLSIVKEYVMAHGGSAEILAEEGAAGSHFRVRLPLRARGGSMKATVLVAGSMAMLVAGCSAPPVTSRRGQRAGNGQRAGAVSEPGTVSEPPVVAIEPEIKPPVRPAVSDSETLLTYVDHVRKLPAAEFAKELDTVRKLYARARTEMIRMRYAILLSAPAAGPGEDARAMELLDPLLKSARRGGPCTGNAAERSNTGAAAGAGTAAETRRTECRSTRA